MPRMSFRLQKVFTDAHHRLLNGNHGYQAIPYVEAVVFPFVETVVFPLVETVGLTVS